MFRLKLAIPVLLAVAGACSDDNGTDPGNGELVTLTSAQAAAIVARVEAFGAQDASLAALADTVDVVVKAGAEARRIAVTTDLGATEYRAVSLHLPSSLSSPASSTFHVIAFDDPSNPTRFIILGGWAQGVGSTPPTAVTGSLSGPTSSTSVTAHLFSVSGSQVSVWHATAGSSSLAANATGQACTGFTGPGTCVRSNVNATFAITGSVAGQGSAATGQRVASGDVSNIPGIRVSF